MEGLKICLQVGGKSNWWDLARRWKTDPRNLSIISASDLLPTNGLSNSRHPQTQYSIQSQHKLALEGMVVQRAECRPAVSESYMKLKKLQIEESTKPLRFSQKLEKAITTNYKPVSNHSYNLEYEKKKKEEGKRSRADKQKVLEMLFSAFEKHQYYNIKDLVDITKQPVIYLKEILREIGVYNPRGPHKSTWELKPEYRHYEEGQEEEEEKME
ncbi:general transcription factor IIF subunit [Pimephales promelas]|nr:general transcription factor IIF subunit [Pimephales promelas]